MNLIEITEADVNKEFSKEVEDFIHATKGGMERDELYFIAIFVVKYDIKFFRKMRVCLSDTQSDKYVTVDSDYLLKLINTLYKTRTIRFEDENGNFIGEYFNEISERVFQLTIELEKVEETLKFPKN